MEKSLYIFPQVQKRVENCKQGRVAPKTTLYSGLLSVLSLTCLVLQKMPNFLNVMQSYHQALKEGLCDSMALLETAAESILL